ncbi:MAG: glycogen/starch synthase [Paramuribaculum sp.]|nr:glycogen/starch synthase [Paramuribaculum sp.]
MAQQKILYISQEITPYLRENPLSIYGNKLPQSIHEKGFEVRTFMPKYGSINERRNQLHEVIRLSGMNIVINDNDHPLIIKVATLQPSRMQVYFIDNDDFFFRAGAKQLETEVSPDDNDERMMFFVKGVIETIRKLRWNPAIIQCTGWISALAPLYIRKLYQDDLSLTKAKIVYALRPEKFDGTLHPEFVNKLRQLDFNDADLEILNNEPVDWIALNKIAMDNSDAIIESEQGVPAELTEYAIKLNKPFLRIAGSDNQIEQYNEFYRSLIAEDSNIF